MQLLILPVSGGGFVSQLAILTHLCQLKYKPDITFASSGGNVAAYVASAANWQWSQIERVAEDISHDLFAQAWSSIPALSSLIGFFSGNAFKQGKGVKEFFLKHFEAETIGQYEIWTGTYNKTRQQACLFCNKTREQSQVDFSKIDLFVTQCMEPKYLQDTDPLPRIAKISTTSASIPAVVDGQIFDGEYYVDGGVCGSSPFTIMHSCFNPPENIHITYVNCLDLASPIYNEGINVLDTWRQATTDLIRSQTLIERSIIYNNLNCLNGEIKYLATDCNYEELDRLLQLRNKARSSLLEIFPRVAGDNNWEVQLTSFTGEDVKQSIRAIYPHCFCRLWYVD